MKTVTVLLILMALVAGVAVRASRAGPMAGPSSVVERCLGAAAISYLCQPMTRIIDDRPDADNNYLDDNIGGDSVGGDTLGDSVGGDSVGGDTLGGDSINPERKVAMALLFAAALAEVAANYLDQLTYGAPVRAPHPLTRIDELFDTSLQ